MTISIVIPVWNHEQYLADAIQSALDQTVECEVVVVNDGSTDKSLEVARRFPVEVIDQINKGLSSARNAGIMNATGDYIFFLDSDDIMQENCIEKIIQKIEETNADVVAPSLKEFGFSSNEVVLMPNPTLADFRTGNRIGYCSAVRTSALKEVGGFSPRMTWGWEDYSLWVDLLKKGKTMATIPEVLVLYRTKEKSMYTESLEHKDELNAQLAKDHPELFF